MAIGPVQLIVLGFDHPEFHGEIKAELERLRESDTIRVIGWLQNRDHPLAESVILSKPNASDGDLGIHGQAVWERKNDMQRRGLASPDDGDALALTFAYPVAKRD